jgi:papain like cysteine protease AvrRpt2
MHLANVPMIHQEKSNSCWQASARMIYGFKKLSCISPLPKNYDHDKGLSASDFVRLAMAIGLRTLPQVSMSYDWTFIDDVLRRYGPIWAAGRWNGFPHIIVITGVDSDGILYVNDPAFIAPQKRDIRWLNERISKDIPIPMMYLP